MIEYSILTDVYLLRLVLSVGTNIGDIVLWDVNSGEKLLSRNFMVWNTGACSMIFKVCPLHDFVLYLSKKLVLSLA